MIWRILLCCRSNCRDSGSRTMLLGMKHLRRRFKTMAATLEELIRYC
jgi:hypothetical protein